jgi:5-methyltetrahydropteroyltriglutamate--homocysteine methyltransferase
MMCISPIKYRGKPALEKDIANLKAAVSKFKISDAFMPSISPATVAAFQMNGFYKTDEEFLHGIADAMREEYVAIVEAGLILQIDDPRLVTHYGRNPQMSVKQCREWAAIRVEALNHALRDLPSERIRHHTCYGINMGPRVHDMELKDIVDIILSIKAGAYSFEAANPRHEHEWNVWENAKLPDGKLLIPGVVTQSSFLVEHPELVAQRIIRFAEVVGRENVIAGTDCGFATFATAEETHPTITWAKLKALSEGAAIASDKLWGRNSSSSASASSLLRASN